MSFTVLVIILIVTVLVSLNAINNEELKNKLMFIPSRCKENGEGYRFISHILVHADLPHLFFNMFTLYFMGKGVEHYFIKDFGVIKGEIYFVVLYVLGGLFATLIPYARNHNNSNYRSLGASGAVSAVVFAFVIWSPMQELLVMGIPMKAWLFGIIYLGLEFYLDKKGNTGVAHDAHIGGAIFGVIFVLIINIDKGKDILDLVF